MSFFKLAKLETFCEYLFYLKGFLMTFISISYFRMTCCIEINCPAIFINV